MTREVALAELATLVRRSLAVLADVRECEQRAGDQADRFARFADEYRTGILHAVRVSVPTEDLAGFLRHEFPAD